MKKLKTCLLLLVCALCFGLWSPVGHCSEVYTITAEQLTTLETQLAMLNSNNNLLLTQLDESTKESTQALESLEESRNETERLRQQLNESNKVISELRSQLEKLKTDSNAAKQSLAIANQELANASKYFKEYEQQTKREINVLRMQRNGWEAVAAILTCGLIGVAVAG